MTGRYDVVTSRKDKDGKIRYTKIGSMFPAKEGKDGFNVVLDALPMPNAEGQAWLSMYPPKPKDDAPARAEAPAERPRSTGRNSDMQDDVPF
jgi:hypothetical protein